MKCPTCDQLNPEHAAHCGDCGAPLVDGVRCARCGVAQALGQRFCHDCGASLGAARPVPAAAGAVPVSFAAGRYEVRRFLGEGAKKRVYLAYDTRLDRDVALAFVKSEGLDPAGLTRVRREARAMGRLGDHPHVVTAFDVGEEDGRTYIVSQYMPGGSIADLLARVEQRRLPVARAVRLADQVARALEHAHARGVVHRDLKPSNVWLAEDGSAKLGDFGLALAVDRSRLTIEGMIVGTVAYMAPEQALGHEIDARSDLYAMGAMLYEMVVGRPPFLGGDAVAVISQHINTAPVAPSWHNPDVPRALEALILRLLAKAPQDRPESAAAVRQALEAIGASAAGGGERVTHGDANPLDRLASGVFVGREHEMDQLRGGLEEALSGRGGLFLMMGEPGIGKTRTAEEFATYARLRKAQVLWGRCYEGEGAPAYWPWVHSIRAYVHEREPSVLLSELGSAAADLAQIISEVRERLPGIPAPAPAEPEQARFRLFDGIATFLRNAARHQALVLVLDDLHWADKPSLLLLQFVARELRGARVLVVGTYRDVDVRRQHPLAQTLGELGREQLAQRILLRGLTQQDVGRFIEITANVRPPPPGLVEAVHRETEGNPFFVNEVVRLLVADGRLEHPEQVSSWTVSIPQGVREVVGRRLDRLSVECNRVLTLAAVIGREFGLDALERVAEVRGERLLEALEEAVGARVIAELPRTAGCYAFTHALIRETLYEELTTTRRVRLHRQIGEALEALHGSTPEPHLAALAYHFCEAAQGGDAGRAIGYAVRAGGRAADLMAHEEAARHFTMALQAFDLCEPRAEGARCELLLRLADTLWRAGEYDRARDIALQAAGVARALGSPEQLARAALAVGGRLIAFAALVPDQTLIGLLEEALATLDPDEHLLRVSVLGRLAEEVTFSEPYARREALCREAVALARRLDSPALLATALRHSHWALSCAENLAERLGLAAEVVRLAEAAGDRGMLLEGHTLRAWNLVEQGDVAGALAEVEVCARLADELRQPYQRWLVALTRVLLAFAQGRLGEVDALAQHALELGRQAQNQNAALVFGVQSALLLRERGRAEEFRSLVLGLEELYPLIALPLRSAVALAAADLGREAEAREVLERVAAREFADLAQNPTWLFSVTYLAEVVAYLGDVERARMLYERLRPFAACNVTAGPVIPLGSASRALGVLAATLGDGAAAARHFEDSLAMEGRMGMRQAEARTQVAYAELLLARDGRGERARCLGLLNRALDTGRELGMTVLVERALATKLRVQGIPQAGVTASIDAVASLVERERPDLRSHAAPDGTVTILFTDIEGSTEMIERLGDRRWLEILHAHNALVRRELARWGGFEVKAQGDGFMVAFASACRALDCAVAIQRACRAWTERHADTPIRVRMGLHTGEAIKEAEDFFGRAVIQAARITSQAAGGEILASSLVRQLAEGAGGVAFGDPREVCLKGFAGTNQVCPVAW